MNDDIRALAYEEAQRLLETVFSYHNPYACIIEVGGIPFEKQETFCQMVEEELLAKGERITRSGAYFKIDRYQKQS